MVVCKASTANTADILLQNLTFKSAQSTAILLDIDAQNDGHKLTNRAIYLHLLREGDFEIAEQFYNEAGPNIETLEDFDVQQKFEMLDDYLSHIKRERNLNPAIAWAKEHTVELQLKGSNLEFDLISLQYIWIFQGPEVNGLPGNHENGYVGALTFGQKHFRRFIKNYHREINRLSSAVAYHSNIDGSPYFEDFDWASAFNAVAQSFRTEFCAMMGLSAESPLYLAVTAGAISLPDLEKYMTIMKSRRAEWSTKNELPVEIALPEKMRYHQVFVCPVSKEQATKENPPMRMPCGHVLAKQSLVAVSKGQRFKCPYCPGESYPRDAKEIKLEGWQ